MIRPRRRPPAHRRPAAEPLEGRAYFAPLAFAKAVSVYAGPHPADVVEADLNGDGLPDVVVADDGNRATATTADSGGISVLFGNGKGGLSPATADPTADLATYPVQTPIQSIAVGDLNGDGLPDVVGVGSGIGYVYVWMNTGGGHLANPVAYPVGASPEGVALADVNGNGHLDIITANQGVVGVGSVSVLLGNGDGTFGPQVGYDGGPNPDALAVGDLNQDGIPDIVTVDPENDELHVLLNEGAAKGYVYPAANTEYTTDLTGRAVSIVDVNNDARPDLVVANLRSATVGALLNNGDGTFQGQVTYRVGGFPFSVSSADLNGDNRPELITADSRDNAVGVLVHNGQGGFNLRSNTTPLQFPTGQAPEAVVAADLNGDGKPDLISADFNDDEVGVLMNQTKFTPLTATTLALTASQNPAEAGNAVALTATITPAPDPAQPAGRVVQFLAGDKVLGVAPLAANGTATVTTTKLAVGATSVVARYGGNAAYAGSVADLTVTVLQAGNAADTPLVSATAVVVTSRAGRAGAPPKAATSGTTNIPAVVTGAFVAATAVAVVGQGSVPFVTGGAGSVAVMLANEGTDDAAGSVAVSLSIAPVGDPAASQALSVTAGGTVAVALAAGGTIAATVSFTLPAALATGSYTISATLAPAAGTLTAAQVSTAAAATAAVPFVQVADPFLPGDAGSVAVTLGNAGPGPAVGSVAVSLTVAPAQDLAAAVPLAVVGRSIFPLDLRGGTSRMVPVDFTLPATLAAGDYTVLATLAPAAGLAAADVVSTPTPTAYPAPVVLAFGTAGVHAHYTLTTTLSTGAVVRLSIAGPGTGSFADDGDGSVTLGLADTSGGSTVSITPVSGTVALHSLSDYSLLGTVNAPAVTLTGTATDRGTLFLADGLRTLTLAGSTESDVTFGPQFKTVVTLGAVADTAVRAAAVLQSVAVARWTDNADDLLYANGVRGGITSAGDFGPAVQVAGFHLRQSIGYATVGGVLSGTWTLGNSVGPITAASVAAGFSGSVAGSVANLTVTGDFAGVLAARTSFGTIAIGGSLTDADLLAGATLGKDGVLGGGDDVFNAGRIARVTVGGSVTGSLVAAGFRPASDDPFTPVGGTLIKGGAIGPVTVTGTIDPTSRFAAAAVPSNV